MEEVVRRDVRGGAVGEKADADASRQRSTETLMERRRHGRKE